MSSMSKEELNSQIVNTTQSLTKPEDMRNQSKLVMQPHEWEKYLTPAPLAIAILGELVFISSKTDFSINKNPPKDGYKYIRHPDSFRACLMQVCNSGWGAFNEAHKNMDQIRLHTMTVPDYMKRAMKIVLKGNEEVIEDPLPDQLENIRVIADDCLALAGSTEKGFTDVINIIQELLEACVNAEHFHGEELEEIQMKLKESKLRKQSSDEAVKRYAKAVKITEEEMNKALESYKAAMDSIPSGLRMVAEDIAGAMSESINVLVNEITSVMVKSENQASNTSKTAAEPYKEITGEEGKSVKHCFSESAVENARFLIEQSRAQINETRETYEKIVENMEKNQKEQTDIFVDMRNCEVKETDFKTPIQMLIRGMDSMGRVKKPWEKMVCFLQMVSNSVEISLTRTFTDAFSLSENTESVSYDSKLFSEDLLNNQAFQATNVASLIHTMSATYTDVSEKYLMDCVISLGKLLTMDKEKPEFEQECLQLQNSCDEAQKGILSLVLKNKDEFEEKTHERLETIDKELLAILPEAAPKVLKSIQSAFESGFTKKKEEDN